MPTGGGKSITFQVPALAMEGVCIVITPLVALMVDQVQNLRQRGIRAAAVFSGMDHDQVLMTLDNAVFGGIKILYVSPERLSSELFITKLHHMRVSFITVDEAHCISQWGYDFRPSYLNISSIRRELPGIPVLALTATATPAVVQDIQNRLAAPLAPNILPTQPSQGNGPLQVLGRKLFSKKMPSSFNVFRMSFERPNLAYIVREASDKRDETIHLLGLEEGSAIVYVRSRRRTKEVADLLNEAGISTTYYHAGLDSKEKNDRQQAWQSGKVRVMVATNAFGMGIDKPDVRMVIHVDCPDSIEAYFQEAGRAGRDGRKSFAVLLFNGYDERKLQKRIADTFPEKAYIRSVYDHLAYYYQVAVGSGYHATFEFNIDDFCHKFHHFPVQVQSALKILNRAGYIEYIEQKDSQARVMFCLSREQLYWLEQTEPDEDRVITALLRGYGGLFVDYVYIDEAFLAGETGLTRPQVYQILKGLSRKRIISFIPQKSTPYIRYAQRREDAEHLLFPPEIYADLKKRYTERIRAIVNYARTDNQCRSRMLLDYFGEHQKHDCGQCDVCMADRKVLTNEKKLGEAGELILQLLEDRNPHHVTQLRSIALPYEQIDAALECLMLEEVVYMDGAYLILA